MPRRSLPDRDSFGAGWFDTVPAYRLASVRIALAVTTLAFHVPRLNDMIEVYSTSAFHVPPTFPWIPPLTRGGGMVLMVLQHLAAWGLLLGWGPRLCAWFLAVAGFYVMSLDPEYYAHNRHFHLTLLALIGCSTDGVSLRRLLADDGANARCPAWPERLIRIQLAIVFMYTAVDKVMSPHWGLSGALVKAQRLVAHGRGLAWLQRANQAVFRAIPGALSVLTIALEGFLGMAFLIRRLWPMGIAVGIVFALYLEFSLRPAMFAWDLLASLLVFAPAGDRAWTAVYDPTCRSSSRNRSLLSPLDWLRRLQWVPAQTMATADWQPVLVTAVAPAGLCLVSPRGRAHSGVDALRVLPLICPGPVLVALALARFAGGYAASRGRERWDDLPFLMLGVLVALWIPGVARMVRGARVLDPRSG